MSKRALLYFGIDHLTINIGTKKTYLDISQSNIYKLFKLIKKIGLNDTNTTQALNLKWDQFEEEIDVYCEYSRQKNEMYSIHWKRYKLMRIERITEESILKQVGYKYDYRITFYGTLFALSRIKKLDADEFLKPFLEDSKNLLLTHSVSRTDICADISGVSPMSIRKGITGNTEKMKKFSFINVSPSTGDFETAYYGKGSKDWHVRIYNKVLDTEKKGKELLYPDYMEHEKVTRVEVDTRSQISQKFAITLPKILELGFALSIYEEVLNTKYVNFKIVKFIKTELKKKGLQKIEAERTKISYETLSKIKLHQRFLRCAERLNEEYEVSLISLGEEVKLLKSDNPEWLDFAYLGFGE
jgi:hypothetical protein